MTHPIHDNEITDAWRSARQTFDALMARLTHARATSPKDAAALDVLIAARERGDLGEACATLAVSDRATGLVADLAAVVDARNRVIELAWRAYGAEFTRMAHSFRRAMDGEDHVAEAWERVLRKIYDWRQDGDFRAWLTTIFRNALRDGLRTQDRRDRRHDAYAVAIGEDPHAEQPSGPGTTSLGNELALRAFKTSLDPEKRQLWDQWTDLGAEGLRPEAIYTRLAQLHGRSVPATKGILLRLQNEFKEMVGAGPAGEVDASGTVALWVGQMRCNGVTAVMATGLDIDDNLRLLAMRQVADPNFVVFERMFEVLRRRGLPQDRRLLVIVDDSAGLLRAAREQFGGRALIQGCVEALIRGVRERLPSGVDEAFVRAAAKAFKPRDALRAERSLLRLQTNLQTHHPDAALVLRDGLESALTVKRLALPVALEVQLSRVEFFADPRAASVGGIFAALRHRRSVELRRAGLRSLVARLAEPG